jgi:nitrogenase molybdenum-iron protein alpha/beta subunit
VAINNDDIRTVAAELSDELDIPVIQVACDGFRSRIAATGYDAAYQAILGLIPHAHKDQSRNSTLINLVVSGDQTSNMTHLVELLSDIGLTVNKLPSGAGKEQFVQAGQASVTIVADADTDSLFAQEIEKNHNVPYLRLPAPVGLDATGDWLAAVGAATGRLDAARALHQERLEDSACSLYNKVFDGTRIYLGGFPVPVAIAVATLVRISGGLVTGISVDHVDLSHGDQLKVLQEKQPGVQLHVAAGQPFEEANLLRRTKPDLYIGTPERVVWAARAGIPVVAIEAGCTLGYLGLQRLFQRAHNALANPAFEQRLSRTAALTYQDAWYRRSPDWHIKLEVK